MNKLNEHLSGLEEAVETVEDAIKNTSNCVTFICELRGNFATIRSTITLVDKAVKTVFDVSRVAFSCIVYTIKNYFVGTGSDVPQLETSSK